MDFVTASGVTTRKIKEFRHQVQKSVKETQDQALAQVGKYALKTFGKSKYARTTLNTIPTSIIANLLKAVVNFLILYRLNTGTYWVDFCVSMLVTIITAAISPIFYVLVKEREADLLKFSNHFADQVMIQGVDYLRMWQSRSAIVIGIIAIIFLLFVEVNSEYLIKVIIEYLLAFWVVDKVNQFRDTILLPYPVDVKREFFKPPKPIQLTKYDLVEIPARTMKKHTKLILPPPKTIIALPMLRAQHFETKQQLVEYLHDTLKRRAKIAGSMRRVMDDWVRLPE